MFFFSLCIVLVLLHSSNSYVTSLNKLRCNLSMVQASSPKTNIFQSFFSPRKSKISSIEEINNCKLNIKTLSKNSQNGIKCTPTQRQDIMSNVLLLEKNNKVKDFSSSAYLNGNWRLVYTTNQGILIYYLYLCVIFSLYAVSFHFVWR